MSDRERITCLWTGDELVRAESPRDDWKMPSPAPECGVCGRDEETDERIAPAVTMTAGCYLEDIWELFWFCPACDANAEDYAGLEIEWPFLLTEFANVADLEKLGFKEIG